MHGLAMGVLYIGCEVGVTVQGRFHDQDPLLLAVCKLFICLLCWLLLFSCTGGGGGGGGGAAALLLFQSKYSRHKQLVQVRAPLFKTFS